MCWSLSHSTTVWHSLQLVKVGYGNEIFRFLCGPFLCWCRTRVQFTTAITVFYRSSVIWISSTSEHKEIAIFTDSSRTVDLGRRIQLLGRNLFLFLSLQYGTIINWKPKSTINGHPWLPAGVVATRSKYMSTAVKTCKRMFIKILW